MSIQLNNVTLSYGTRTLLDRVSTSLPASSLTALIGRNGTGKSTLLRAIAGLGSLHDGQISLCGRPLSQISPEERARTIAFVTTEKVHIPNLTCEDVVALGRAPYTNWIGRLQDDDREIVGHALEVVGMSSFARKTMDAMSDGECQRVMIARALAQDTPIILLDEPTAFLDLPNRYSLALLLARLAHEEHKCVLFSTHDMDIALSLCDSVMLIDTPRLHNAPALQLISQGLIDRLFTGAGIRFDPVTKGVQLEKSSDF